MNLMDLYERQQQELERFNTLRAKVWNQVLTENEKLVAAFGGKEQMTDEATKIYQSRINAFNAEWSGEGSRYTDMVSQHHKQINQVTGRKDEIGDVDNNKQAIPGKEKSDIGTKGEFKNQSEHMTDRNRQASKQKEDAERQQLRERGAVGAARDEGGGQDGGQDDGSHAVSSVVVSRRW